MGLSISQFNKTEQDIRLEPKFDTEEGSKSDHNLGKKRRVLDKEVTIDAYQDSKVFDMRFYKDILISIKEVGGVNAIKYNVLACIDPTIWETLASDIPVSQSSSKYYTVSDAWLFIKVQVASNVAGNAGKATVFIGGKTPR